jgi:hypothetical protein
MRPYRTGRGTLIVPWRAETVVDGRRVHGDGVEEIGPDHPDFERWSETVDRYAALATAAQRGVNPREPRR